MNTNDEMTPQQLLNAAIDGELDSVRSERLSSLMAENPDLRSDYAITAAIRKTTLASISSFKPAPQLTKATFERIGISKDVAIDGSESSVVNSARIPASLRRTKLPLLIVVSGSILVVLVLFFLLGRNAEPPNREAASPPASTYAPAVPQNTTPPARAQAYSGSNVPTGRSDKQEHEAVPKRSSSQSGTGTDFDLHNAVPDERAAMDAVEKTASDAGRAAAGATQSLEPEIDHVSSTSPATAVPGMADQLQSKPIGHFDVSTDGEMYVDPAITRVSSNLFALHLRSDGRLRFDCYGYSMQSFPSTSVPMRSKPFVRNMSFGVAWMITPNQSLGISVGQEGFPQKYDGRENEIGVHYEQNLLTQWIAATYRVAFPLEFLPFGISPFINVGGGATLQAWPIVRATGGLQWMPAGNLVLSVGIEGGTMLYSFQSSWFATNKLGVTYGVSYVF